MRILKLSAYSYPERVASSHLGDDLNEAYKKAGFKIDIFAPTPTRGIDEETRKKYCKIKYQELEDGMICIHRFNMFREGKNPIQRAIRYILTNIIQFFKGCSAKNIDVILGTSTPPTQGLLCAMVKKVKKIPFIYNLQDIFPDSLVNAKMTREGSIIWKIGRVIENFTYKNADKIIVISEDFKENIMKKGVPEEKIEVIYNWINEEKVYPIKREDNLLVERLGLDKTKFYITYCGNIGLSQNFEMLLEAAKLLEDDSQIEILIFGEGAFKDELVKLIQEKKIINVKLFPFQPYEDIAHVFSLGDASLVISKPNIGSSSVPSKTWSILSAGRPVVASFDINSQLCKFIKNNNCGICSDAGDLKGFVDGVKELKNNPKKITEYGKNGREYILNNLTKDVGTGKYVDLIKSVAKKKL